MPKSGLNKMTFVKDLMGFSVSTWINAALSFFATPIITRVFLPDELGKINLFITIVNIFMTFSYLGIDQAFTRFYHEPPGRNDKKSFLSICVFMSAIVAILLLVGVMLFGKRLSMTTVGYVTYVIPITMICSIVSQMLVRFLNLAARMEKNIILYNIQAILFTILSNLSYVAVAFYSATAVNAIVFRTGSLFIAAFAIFFLVRKRSFSMKMDLEKNVVKELLLYALPLCPAAVLVVLNNSIGQLILKKYLDYSAIGIYSNAVTVSAILTILQSGFNNYWGPFVYEHYKTNQKVIMRVHHLLSFGIILFALFIILFQDLIYGLLIGEKYWASKQIFPLLIISPVCYTIAETLGMGIRLTKRTYLNIPVAGINLAVNVGLCLLLIPKWGVVGAASAAAISAIANLLVRSILGETKYRCSDNYAKVSIAMAVLTTVAALHTFMYDSLDKYLLYIAAIIVVSIAYWSEVKMIARFSADVMKKIKH